MKLFNVILFSLLFLNIFTLINGYFFGTALKWFRRSSAIEHGKNATIVMSKAESKVNHTSDVSSNQSTPVYPIFNENSTEQSVETTEKTVKPTEQSVKTTEQSVKPTEQSIKPTEHSVKTTEQTVRPTEVTVQPVYTTAKPIELSSSPTVNSIYLKSEEFAHQLNQLYYDKPLEMFEPMMVKFRDRH